MPLSILTIPLPVVYGTDGAIVDVSALKGEKSILLSGSFQGQYVLLGSHDDINFKPLFSFSGTGVLSIKQILKESIHSVRFRSLATGPVGMTASISGESVVGSNGFVTLPIVLPGGYGEQPISDLFALAPPSGLLRGTNLILSGNFMGMVTVDGSMDGVRFSPIGAFRNLSLPGLNDGLQPTVPEHEPLVYTEQVRYVRINVMAGTFVSTPLTITIGGEVAVSVGSDSYLSEPITNASGTPLLKGEVVRISADDAMTRALADVPANIRGLVGVMLDAAAVASIQEVVSEGKCFVLLEPALVPVAGDPIWVSGTIAGRATNVLPALDAGLGVIKDASMYAATGGVVADVDPAPTASVLAAFTLTTTYLHGANAADQTMTLNDANGGGIIVDGSTAPPAFTGANAFSILGRTALGVATTAVFPRIGGLDLSHGLGLGVANPGENGAAFAAGALTVSAANSGRLEYELAGQRFMASMNGGVYVPLLVGPAAGGFTQGSVPFGSATGTLVQDNANFFFDDTRNTLQLGGATAYDTSTLSVLATKTIANPAPIDTWKGINFQPSTLTLTAGGFGDPTALSYVFIGAPTINGNTYTVPTASTLTIAGQPTGTTAITNPLALWVQSGYTSLANRVGIGTTAPLKSLDIVQDGTVVGPTTIALFDSRVGNLAKSYFASGPGFFFLGANRDASGVFSDAASTAANINLNTGALDSYIQFYTSMVNGMPPEIALKITNRQNLIIGELIPSDVPSSRLQMTASKTVTAVAGVGATVWHGFNYKASTLSLTMGGAAVAVDELSASFFAAPLVTSVVGAGVPTIATMSTVTIGGPPTALAGTSLPVIATPLSLWVQSGNNLFSNDNDDYTKAQLTLESTHATGHAVLRFRSNGALRAGMRADQTGSTVVYGTGNLFLFAGGDSGVGAEVIRCTASNYNCLIGVASPDVASSRFQAQANKTIASAAGAIYDGINFLASTVSITGPTAITTATGFNYVNIAAPTYNGDTATCVISYAATLAISGAPTDNDKVTVTNPYAFWIQAGNTRLNGGQIVKGVDVNAAGPYLVTATDFCIEVRYTITGTITITLPTLASTENGRIIVIKDSGYNATANNITVGRNGATINGVAADYTIGASGTCVWLKSNTTTGDWEII